MKWGLIARAESDRGLGVLTRLMYQHLGPDKVLLVTVGHEYRQETEAFPGATVVQWNDEFDETTVQDWMEGLDVIVSAEIFYDWRIVEWARDRSIRTVLYVMPELFKKEMLTGELPRPDQFWYPTTWQPHSSLPAGDLLPVPCEERPFVDYPDGKPSIIHVAGKPALADRNGTSTLATASKRVGSNVNLTVYSQANLSGFHSSVKMLPGPTNKWEMYENAHLLVMPRRFGGLCLPVIEALSCGVGVAMPNISPNNDWPILRMHAEKAALVEMPVGTVQTYGTDLADLTTILRTVEDAEYYMTKAREWAVENTWAKRKHLFQEALR